MPAGDHWKLGLRFACPSAAANAGKPLAEHLAEAREYAAALEAESGTNAIAAPPPPLQKKQRDDVRAVLTAEQQAKFDAMPTGGGGKKKNQ